MWISAEYAVRAPGGDRLPADTLHEQGEQLMAKLADLEQVNPHVGNASTYTDLGGHLTVVKVRIRDTADEAQAVEQFLAVVRAAIRSIGGAVAGWEPPARPVAEYQPRRLQVVYSWDR